MKSRNSKLRKKLFTLIRKYFLDKAERDRLGRIFCPLKKKWYTEDNMQVCHFIDRFNTRLRYEEDNLLLASKESNYYDSRIQVKGYKSKHHMDYELYIGEEAADKLRRESQLPQLELTEDILQYYYDYYTKRDEEE